MVPADVLLGGLGADHGLGIARCPLAGPTVSQKRFEPTPIPWCRFGQMSPGSTHYNRRHFHVSPSSVEIATLLPLQSQIVPSATSIATWPPATLRPGAQRVRPRVRLPFFSVSDWTVTPSQSSRTPATQYRPLPAATARVFGIRPACRHVLPELWVLIASPLSQTTRARDRLNGARPMT